MCGSQHQKQSSLGKDLQPRFHIKDGSVIIRNSCCSVKLRLEPKSRFISLQNHLSHLKASRWKSHLELPQYSILNSHVWNFYNRRRENLSNWKKTPVQTVQFIQDLNKFLNRPNKLVSACSCASCSFCCLCSSFIFFLSASFSFIASFFSW